MESLQNLGILVPIALEEHINKFKATFDFERFKHCGEPKMLEILIPGHCPRVIDGQKKLLIC